MELKQYNMVRLNYCTSLTDITIPDSVTSIASWVFDECVNLARITIPSSVTSIGKNPGTVNAVVYFEGSRQQWDKALGDQLFSCKYVVFGINDGSWKKNNKGWWYRRYDGSYPKHQFEGIDGQVYYFDSNGYMVTGWQKIDGKWYYFSGSGAMQKDWQKIGSTWYYFNGSGVMQTGWQKIGSKWYYFEGSGVMAANKWVGNYYLTASGAMATNTWIGKYYVGADGKWIPGYKAAN